MSQKLIKKVYIEPGCISCGTCESVCPAVFKVTDIAHVVEGAPISNYEAEIREASEICPVSVIKYEEEE